MAESRSPSSRNSRPSDGPKTSRTFVWLRELPSAIPRGNFWDQLNRDGRVKIIEFGKKSTREQMRGKIRLNFPELAEADFKRLRLYKSGSRGSVLTKICKSIPDAAKLLRKCRDTASKRVYILLKRETEEGDSQSGQDSNNTSVAPAASSSIASRPADGVSTRQFLTSLARNASQGTENGNADSAELPGADSPQMQDSVGLQRVEDDSMDLSIVGDDADLLHSTFETEETIELDSVQDAELQHSPYNTVEVIELDSVQENRHPVRQQQRQRVSKTATSTRSTSNSGFFGTPFYGEGTRVGITIEDLATHGLGVKSNLPSRTNEIVRCEKRLIASCTGDDTSLPSFITHSFDELCWQARDMVAAVVIVLLHPTRENISVREGILRAIKSFNNESQGKDWLFWAAETSSPDGKRVCRMFGARQTEDSMLVIVPSSMGTPTLIEAFLGSNVTVTDIKERLAATFEQAGDNLKVLSQQRKRYAQWLSERGRQERDLVESEIREEPVITDSNAAESELQEEETVNNDDAPDERREKENEEEIKTARKARIVEEPTQGHTIRVRTPNGVMTRTFGQNAHYQEVYDWVGAIDDVPLHFTLHRGGSDALVSHDDKIESEETVNLKERTEHEATSMLDDQISFKGNYRSKEDLSDTVEDEHHQRSDTEAGKGVEGGAKPLKRKRKDKRLPKDRREKNKQKKLDK